MNNEVDININDFDSICPYTDEEAAVALSEVAEHPAVSLVSKAFYPDKEADYLKNVLKNIKSVEEFQRLVMNRAVEWILDTSSHIFSYNGIENIKRISKRYVAISNHRDIIIDPAILQSILYRNGLETTQIAVGDNLLSNKFVEKLIRSNRMIKVIRGINARTLYLSSQLLSNYIRTSVTSGASSIWIAQREGRSKNGIDKTEQGLLKMLDMSGTKSFVENFEELNIVPLSISYEYEPCDIRKAREILISRTEKYVKAPNEDLESIMTGIQQQKGNIHLNIGLPLTVEEIENASKGNRNERYQSIRYAIDNRIVDGYKLWKTNYMAYDLVNRGFKYSSHYTPEQMSEFTSYVERQLDLVTDPALNRNDLRECFLNIYANPVVSKEKLEEQKS